jgi:hypothetical protein
MRYASVAAVHSKLSFVCLVLAGCITVPDIATERDGGPFDGAQCPEGSTDMCEGNCVNFNRDPNNCSSCGNICDLNEDCLVATASRTVPSSFFSTGTRTATLIST